MTKRFSLAWAMIAALAVLSAVLIFAFPIFSLVPIPAKIIAIAYYTVPLAIFGYLFRKIEVDLYDLLSFAIVSSIALFMFFGGNRFFSEFATADFMDQYVDTSFHIALINAIARYGYPSTDLHFGQFSWYHVATHYYDAGFAVLTGRDIKSHYSLISFVKVAVGLATIFASVHALRFPSRIKAVFSYVLISLFVASTWLIVESHGLWLPMIVALLALPLIQRGWHRPDARFGMLFAIASIIVILGKISLGVPFVFIIGLTLWVRHMREPVIYAAGLSIFVVFAINLYFLMQSIPTEPLNERHYLHVKGVGIPLCLAFYALAFFRNGIARAAVPAVTACFVIYVFILYALDNLSDVVYFNIGLWFSVVAVITLDLSQTSTQDDDPVREWVPRFVRSFVYSRLVRTAALCVGPTAILVLYAGDSVLPRASLGWQRVGSILYEQHPVVQDDIENRLRSVLDRRDRTAALFVPSAIWRKLLARRGNTDLKPSDYSLKFVSTVDRPLVHGVPPDTTYRYLFFDYGDDARWQSGFDGDCGPYDRVLILRKIEPIIVEQAQCRPAQ
ncbi:MAG: hypothetical protein WA948_06720 [Pontixanthobacter sp.]